MPVVRIDVLAGRSPEMLERLIERVSQTVSETLDTPIDRVRVVITEVPPHLWGIGGVPASRVPGRVPSGARGGPSAVADTGGPWPESASSDEPGGPEPLGAGPDSAPVPPLPSERARETKP